MFFLAGSIMPSSNDDYAVRLVISLAQFRITSHRKEPSMRAFEGATFIGTEYTINVPFLSSRC
jgi:hypothetical protein